MPFEEGVVEDASAETYKVAEGGLRELIARLELLDEGKKEIAEQQKEMLAEARARGYDVKFLRKLIALRKKGPAVVAEEDAILDLYREALSGWRVSPLGQYAAA